MFWLWGWCYRECFDQNDDEWREIIQLRLVFSKMQSVFTNSKVTSTVVSPCWTINSWFHVLLISISAKILSFESVNILLLWWKECRNLSISSRFEWWKCKVGEWRFQNVGFGRINGNTIYISMVSDSVQSMVAVIRIHGFSLRMMAGDFNTAQINVYCDWYDGRKWPKGVVRVQEHGTSRNSTAKLCRAEMMVGLCGCGGVQTCKSESGGKQLLPQVGPWT